MSVTVNLKHSSTKDKAPVEADLSSAGEIALNLHPDSPALYIKNADGNIVKLAGANSASTDTDALKKSETASQNMVGDLTLGTGLVNGEKITFDASEGTATFTEKVTIEKDDGATLWLANGNGTNASNTATINFGYVEGAGAIEYNDINAHSLNFIVGGQEIVRMKDDVNGIAGLQMSVGQSVADAMFCVNGSGNFAYESPLGVYAPHIKLERIDTAGAITGKITTDDAQINGEITCLGEATFEGNQVTITGSTSEPNSLWIRNVGPAGSDSTAKVDFGSSQGEGSISYHDTLNNFMQFKVASKEAIRIKAFDTSATDGDIRMGVGLATAREQLSVAKGAGFAYENVNSDSARIKLLADGTGTFTNGIGLSGGSVANSKPGGIYYVPADDVISLTARNYDASDNPASDVDNSYSVFRLSRKRTYDGNRIEAGGDLSIESLAGDINLTADDASSDINIVSANNVNITPTQAFNVVGSSSFDGLVESTGGIKVSGGTAATVEEGLRKQGTTVRVVNNNTDMVSVSTTQTAFNGRIVVGDQGLDLTTGNAVTVKPSMNFGSGDSSVLMVYPADIEGTYNKLSLMTAKAVPSQPFKCEAYIGLEIQQPNNAGTYMTKQDGTATPLVGCSSQINGTSNYNFYAGGSAPSFFAGDIECDGLVNGAFSLRMQTDNPSAFTQTLVIDEEGNELSRNVYNGTTEDLLSIITDLRARVASLEAAAGGTTRKK